MYTSTLQSTPIDDEGYKRVILDFIENNQGCTKQAVVTALEKYRSRKSVFKLLRKLENDKIIIDSRGINKPNRRGDRLVVNKNNLRFSIPKELDEFEKAYIKLLQQSQERVLGDYPIIRRQYSIKEADPYKWDPSYIRDYRSNIWERFQDAIDDVSVNDHYEDLSFNRLEKRWQLIRQSENLLKRLGELVKNSHKLSCMSKPEFNVLVSNAKNMLTQLDPKSDFSKHLKESYRKITRFFYNLEGYNHHILLTGAITIFQLFKDLIDWKSIMIWPNVIQDKETLSELYSIAYSKVANLQLQLSQFISSNILFSNIDSNRLLIERLHLDDDILVFYFSLGLEKDIVPVSDLLINMLIINQSMWEYIQYRPFWYHFFCYYKMEHLRKQLKNLINQLRDLYSQASIVQK